MEIGILGSRGIPNAYGGFEQFAQYLAKGLVERGHQVTVYNPDNHPYKNSSWQGVHIIHCHDPENKIGTIGQFLYDLNCIKDARRRKFNILLQLGYTSSSIWHMYWPKKTINVINMDGLEWKRSKYNKLTRWFLKWAEKMAARHADILIADSMGIQEHIQKTYSKKAVYVPYGADIPENFSIETVKQLGIEPFSYCLLIARMEPENNIEMISKGYEMSGKKSPLLIVGNTENKYGKYLSKKYASSSIKFPGAIYDQLTINSLRHFSELYLHGHSVGGTNPSLLEAMACGCNIAAHDNIFNRAILGNDAYYFSNPEDVRNIIGKPPATTDIARRKTLNIEKIEKTYNWEKIIKEYEAIFLRPIE